MDINFGSADDSKFAYGVIIDICIGSTYLDTNNMLRKITLNGIYNNVTFDDEHSKSNNLNLIDKIRYTRDSSNHGHIDIHYNYSSRSYLWVTFDVHTFVDRQDEHVASNLTAVADSPAGETVVTEYTFATNKRPLLSSNIFRIRRSYTNITINSNNGYTLLDSFSSMGISSQNYCLGFHIVGWSGFPTYSYQIIRGSNGTDFYLASSVAGTFSSFTVEYWFADLSA